MQQALREKPPRRDMDIIVHENTYRRLTAPELRRMPGKSTGGEDFEGWMQAFCARKYNSDFSVEMTESVREYLESFRRR